SPRAGAVLGRGDAERPQPAQVQGGAGEVPLVAHLRQAAEDEATKAHRLLALRVATKDVPYARGPNSAAGRRGRRRSAYEAPRAAADRGTRLGGAESKRRWRPRLPAPPSRVTLLGRRYAPRPQPAQARSHSPRTFVTPRNMKRRRAIACLLAACRRKTCGTRAGPNSAAGRRGRRRRAYEAPRAAADGGTRLGGAESQRRRRPRLPAPPSRVTLLGAAPLLAQAERPSSGRRPAQGPNREAPARQCAPR